MPRFFATAASVRPSGRARCRGTWPCCVGSWTPCALRLREPRPKRSRPLTPPVTARFQRRTSSSFAGGLSRPTYAGFERASPRRQDRSPHAGLERRAATARGAFRRFSPRSCDRGGELRATCSIAFRSTGTDSRAAMKPAAVRGGQVSASRYSDLLGRLATPLLDTERVLLTDFCIRLVTCAPAEPNDARGVHPTFAWHPRPTELSPRRTSRVTARLTAHRELGSTRSRSRRCGGRGHLLILVGLRSSDPQRGAPSPAALSSACEECVPTS